MEKDAKIVDIFQEIVVNSLEFSFFLRKWQQQLLQYLIHKFIINDNSKDLYLQTFPSTIKSMHFPRNNIEATYQKQPEPSQTSDKVTPSSIPKNSKHDVYYQGNKKNQLNELKAYFKNTLSNPDLTIYQKQIVKKIILYTTYGVDTSRLYPQMVFASATKDLVQKKLIFQYLNVYSKSNTDFARMAVNTFMKDSLSNDPQIRSLAIRHLSDMRFKGRQEYLMPILKKGLQDYSSHVKKACLMGLTKLITQNNRLRDEPERDEELLNTLYGMIRNNDPNVVCCVMEAINQIQPEGIAMSKKLTQYIMKNLSIFGQYHLCIILNYVQLYDPKSQEQVLQFLGILRERIRSQNSALVLAISKIFLKYRQIQPALQSKILLTLKPSLLAFINNPLPQIEYPILKHIIYIIKSYQTDIFVKQIRKFYIGQDNPTYIKKAKIQLMALNCVKDNFTDIITQICENMRDPSIIKQSTEALSYLIIKSSDLQQCRLIIKTLSDLIINLKDQYQNLCDYSILVIRTFLRKYPEEFSILETSFYQLVRGINLKVAKCAMLQIIGDYGQYIEDAIQLIVWSENNIDDEVKISLLRANIKLFFKRPIQMLNIVNNLFRAILQDEQTRLPVRDYAAMLYRAMQSDMDSFKKVFLSVRNFSSQRQQQISEDMKNKIKSLEFNTLQLAYNQNKAKWLIDKTKYIQLLDLIQYEDEIIDGQNIGQLDPIALLEKKRSLVIFSDQYHQIQPDDINTDYEMSAEEFQKNWEQYQVGSSITRIIKQIDVITEQTLEQLFNMWHISVMASAQTEQSIKQFLYLKLFYKNQVACMEFEVMKEVETMTLVVKCQNEQLAGFVSKYIEDFIKLNDII